MKITYTGLESRTEHPEQAAQSPIRNGSLNIDISGLAQTPKGSEPTTEMTFDPALYSGIDGFTTGRTPPATPLSVQVTPLSDSVTPLSFPVTPLSIQVTPLSYSITPLSYSATPLSARAVRHNAREADERRYKMLSRAKNACVALTFVSAIGFIGFLGQEEPQYGKALLAGAGMITGMTLSNACYDKKLALAERLGR